MATLELTLSWDNTMDPRARLLCCRYDRLLVPEPRIVGGRWGAQNITVKFPVSGSVKGHRVGWRLIFDGTIIRAQVELSVDDVAWELHAGGRGYPHTFSWDEDAVARPRT